LPSCVAAALLVFGLAHCLPACGQDIVLNDFEGKTYGSGWRVTGTAFGAGPVQGAFVDQQPVTNYWGHGLADSYLGGDAATGTLTSPAFAVQRRYIKFLIGGGNHQGRTCVNLIAGGRVVRSAVGMGDREDLGWIQWNVSELIGRKATLQIVDGATGAWGHINVDQIVETDRPLPNVITARKHYLNVPIRTGAPKHLVELVENGRVVREFNAELADRDPGFYAFLDLTPFLGQDLVVRIDSKPATPTQISMLAQRDAIIAKTPIYQEALRPVYHYTARRGWINDPNGMVYYNGEYHLCYQHNPYGWNWENMHWGHAVSTDLVHWKELPEALYPDRLGNIFSGSTVVDTNNTAGFGAGALVSFYTSAGAKSYWKANPTLWAVRMSAGQPFTQSLAYSTDGDRTFKKYGGNPVIPNLAGGDNRDPSVIWYVPGHKWVMSLWLKNHDYGFFSSTDLIHWKQTSTFTFPDRTEVPELFALPLDGNPAHTKWILLVEYGAYYVGTFDGNAFTPQSDICWLQGGNNFGSEQVFRNIPASDGRCILIANGHGDYHGMPFNRSLNFPVELTLKTSANGPRLYVNPVHELRLLRVGTRKWGPQSLSPGLDPMAGTVGEAFELDAQFQPGTCDRITFNLRGTTVTYDNVRHQVRCNGLDRSLNPENGTIRFHILVDRGTLEVYANNGLLYMPVYVTPTAGAKPTGISVVGNGAKLLSLTMHTLGSAWQTTPKTISRGSTVARTMFPAR
jgi:fructan beta-fructosidase